MDYFTHPSALAYTLLVAGIILSLGSLVNTALNAASRAVTLVVSARVLGITGVALLTAGAVPLLFAPMQSLLEFAGLR